MHTADDLMLTFTQVNVPWSVLVKEQWREQV